MEAVQSGVKQAMQAGVQIMGIVAAARGAAVAKSAEVTAALAAAIATVGVGGTPTGDAGSGGESSSPRESPDYKRSPPASAVAGPAGYATGCPPGDWTSAIFPRI